MAKHFRVRKPLHIKHLLKAFVQRQEFEAAMQGQALSVAILVEFLEKKGIIVKTELQEFAQEVMKPPTAAPTEAEPDTRGVTEIIEAGA